MSRQPRLLHRSFAGGQLSVDMYSRLDDNRYQAGARLLQNMISKPQGPAFRRGGTRLVRKVKDNATGRKVRLIPFEFNVGDTFAIETSRATIDAREIGYFRFHTQGGTLLYDKPRDYVTPKNVSSFASAGTVVTVTGHGLTTGDAVAFTLTAVGGSAVTINTATDEVTAAGSYVVEGSPVMFDAATMPTTGGTTSLERFRIYYATQVSGAIFKVAQTPGGTPINFTSTGTTVVFAAMPAMFGSTMLPNVIYYARVLTADTFVLHRSKGDAAGAANTLSFQSPVGIGTRRMHRAYEPGEIVYWTGVGPGVFSCMRRPWIWMPQAPTYCYTSDHTGHSPPAATNYWCRISGTFFGSTTVNTTTDRIDVGTAHGLENGDPFILGGTAPGGLTTGSVYYVRNKGTTDFEVSAQAFGPRIDLTTTGSGVTVFANPFYEVPHQYRESDLFSLTMAQSNDVLSIACKNRPLSELRRYGATSWSFSEVTFGALTPAPNDLTCPTAYRGQATQVAVNSPDLWKLDASGTNPSNFNLAIDETVYVRGLGTQGIADGNYKIHSSTPPAGTHIVLADLDTGARITAGSSGGTGYVHASLSIVSDVSEYAVTSIDQNGDESEASNVISVTNNLFVQGAYNTLQWSAIPGASRYRVYKKTDGLLGLIGQTEGNTFTDDNISPDLSITPPIIDRSLKREATVTIDTSGGLVFWTGHGLPVGTPVIFRSNAGLPTGLLEEETYYVLNPSPDTFQVSAVPFGATPVSMSPGGSGQIFATAGQFPAAVSYFEGRRVMAGPVVDSQDVWLTASGTESDLSYSLPTVDSDRIQFRVALRNEAGAICHVVPMTHLLLLTKRSEVRVTPINDDALTPTSVSVRAQSYVGANSAQPLVVNNTVVFAADRGGHLRELGFNMQVGSYLTGDLSIRTADLFDDFELTQLAFTKAPLPIVWAISTSGKLLGMTYVPEESVGAWHEHSTQGTFESVISLPEGEEDSLYLCVLRNGVRFIEWISEHHFPTLADNFFVDCGITYNGAPTTTVFAPHLASRQVAYLADGVPGTATVSSAGVLTLPKLASKVHYGLAYDSEIQSLPMALQIDQAFGVGAAKNINKVIVRVSKSGQFQVGPNAQQLFPSPAPAAGQLLTQLVPVTLPGSWNDEGLLVIRQSNPLPLSVIGITIEVAPGG